MRDLSLSLPQSIFQKKTKGGTSNFTHVNIAILSLIVAFGFLYLFQINSLGTRGYEIRQLEQKIATYQDENKQLQIQSSSLSSITKIQQQAEALRMVPANNVTYIKDADFALR
ncbi:MAG TPA: hypothetical protein VEC17_02440 [Candidatus Binatia bacterium]|nr:hypothetical protein [Candidatus Binatia bacterium]